MNESLSLNAWTSVWGIGKTMTKGKTYMRLLPYLAVLALATIPVLALPVPEAGASLPLVAGSVSLLAIARMFWRGRK
jgi:hypothetical protein